MPSRSIRIVLVEPVAREARSMAKALLRGVPTSEVEVVASAEDALERLAGAATPPHLLISEYGLPGANAAELVREITRRGIPVPVVVAASEGNEEIAVECLRAGAADYLPRRPGYLTRLPQAALEAIVFARKHLAESGRRTRLEHTTRVLRKRDQNRNSFLSAACHELRTPLTVIRAAIDNSADGVYGSITDDQRGAYEKMLNHIDRLVRLVNDLLDISRLEDPETPLRRSPVDLAEWARETVDTFAAKAAEQRLQVVVQADPTLTAQADRDRITQVLTNLLSNAFKFTPPGGVVTVVCRAEGDGQASVQVQDTGLGIPADEVDRIFERFHRCANQPPGVKGTGLGLAICKEIVTRHGGRIWVESRPQGGTTFGFTLPLGKPLNTGRTPVVVIVDDHEDSLDMLARYVQSATAGRCRVVTANRPEDAIDFLAAHDADLVLTDICMPDVDGIKLTQVAKARQPGLKVVLMTAYHEYYTEEETRTLGADAYLAKPLDFRKVRDLVKTLAPAEGHDR